MNPNDHGPTLTVDESIRLAEFLAKHGHTQAAWEVISSVSSTLALAAYEEFTR